MIQWEVQPNEFNRGSAEAFARLNRRRFACYGANDDQLAVDLERINFPVTGLRQTRSNI
jgi:hypothetical protein